MSKYEVSFWSKMVWVKWFELGLLSYLINLQWDDCYSNNCDEMSKFEVSILSKLVCDRATISYKWDDCYSGNWDEMSNSKFLIDPKWFELELLSYW